MQMSVQYCHGGTELLSVTVSARNSSRVEKKRNDSRNREQAKTKGYCRAQNESEVERAYGRRQAGSDESIHTLNSSSEHRK